MLLKRFFTLTVTMKKPNTCELFLLGAGTAPIRDKRGPQAAESRAADYMNCFKALLIKQFSSL